MKKLLLFLFIAISFALKAQETQKFFILAGKLFDSESGQFKTGMAILVNDTKIEAVKPEKDITAEEKKNYTLIDLSQYAVLPGLIDCHTHLLDRFIIHYGNNLRDWHMGELITMDGDAYRAIYGAVRAKAYLEAGITAVQDLGNSGQFADVALRRAIDEGLVPGPHMRCAGPGLSTEGGQMPGLLYKHRDLISDEYRIVKSPEDAVQAVRENITQGASVIKIYSNNTPNNTMLSVDEIKAIVQEAHRYGIRVTAHATDNIAVYNAVIGGVDGIEHGYDVDDTTLELMAKKHVILVPTNLDSVSYMQAAKLAMSDDKNIAIKIEAIKKVSADELQRAIKKGVIIAAGSDDIFDLKMPFAEPSKRTLIAYYEEGAAIPQVLQFATINASKQLKFTTLDENRKFHWSEQIGIIKAGYLADIIAVDNDLDKIINAILNTHFVMKMGKIYVNK